MRAVDTNIVARFILNDDPVQSPKARAIIVDSVHVSLTVLLETAWLLGSRYRLPRPVVHAALSQFIDLPSVSVEKSDLTQWALERYERGADIADMIHIIASAEASVFLSFEDKLADKAGPDSPVPVEKP